MEANRLLELFDARQVGGVVSDEPVPQGLDVMGQETYFRNPAELEALAKQAGGRRRRKTQRGRKGRSRNRSTFKLNLRAQIRLRSRSRSQRRH
jgi:hypothetical protein